MALIVSSGGASLETKERHKDACDFQMPQQGEFSEKQATAAIRKRSTSENLTAQHTEPGLMAKRNNLGVAFKNLHVYGLISEHDYHHTVATAPMVIWQFLTKIFGRARSQKFHILQEVGGVVRSGQMLAVLGRPGSGCSTLLKTLAGDTDGIIVDDHSLISYQGLSPADLHKEFRDECTYTAEHDVHFPELTVAETLRFAYATRFSEDSARIDGKVTSALATFNLTDSSNTKMGNEVIRGVSGGEKKRVTIAEALAGESSIQCWDNSTRGMDSETALTIIRYFRYLSKHQGTTTIVSLYQASQRALDEFDIVTVLYQGRQIFFGSWEDGLQYFESLGFQKPAKMTTGDFFTALTNPAEARNLAQEGKEDTVPITADDFVFNWKLSTQRTLLLGDIQVFQDEFSPGHATLDALRKMRISSKRAISHGKSPYVISIPRQVTFCLGRGVQRLRNNIQLPISTVLGNTIMGLIVGSIFYNLKPDSDSMPKRAVLLFFSTLLNSFMSGFEGFAVWQQRPICEKHQRYAWYHPFAEAVSAMLCDIPAKISATVLFNVVLYFITNLRREPSAFFIYLLFIFTSLMTMSMFFRGIASMSRTIHQSMVPIGILTIVFVIYTGFVIPERYMHPWLSWCRWINPVWYSFAAVMINEFHNQRFPCSQYIPGGPGYNEAQKICISPYADPDTGFVDGTKYLELAYSFRHDQLWRNYWILLLFMGVLCTAHVVSSEFILAQKSKGEVLIFLRGTKSKKATIKSDEETQSVPEVPRYFVEGLKLDNVNGVEEVLWSKSSFCWKDLSYEITVNKHSKTLLTEISGWVKPGTLTALMGSTGAGKTTLLDVLAQRASTGVVTGSVCVNGRERGDDFQRKTGYAQQADVHLPTSTVREALQFAALLRQASHITKSERLAHVEEVIEVLEMESFADALVGVPGQGLNIEQRKRLTIGVELAAKPEQLLFLDEPTSGLDSQSAWTICTLLKKLASRGLAILCTIHQPSSTLLQMFDRLLLIESGGRTIYCGETGRRCETLISYLEGKGARACGPDENPAEYLMEVTAPGNYIEWFREWKTSPEHKELLQQIEKLTSTPEYDRISQTNEPRVYAASLTYQLRLLIKRTLIEYWRDPAFLWAKFLFTCGSTLAIAFSCWKAPRDLQGLQTQLFAIFLFFTSFSAMMQQIVPQFTERRALFEAREGPSKMFSWSAFLLAAIITETVGQTILSALAFALFYYPMGMFLDVPPEEGPERAALMFMFFLMFMLFTSTFSYLLTVGMEHRETIVNIGALLFYLILIFCGVLVAYNELPKFWTFMYWLSPLTYLIRGMFAVGLAHKSVECSAQELIRLVTPDSSTCREYLGPFIVSAGGALSDPNAIGVCSYCPLARTDELLKMFKIEYKDRWLNLGVMFIYVGINVVATFGVYWLARVPKGQRVVKA